MPPRIVIVGASFAGLAAVTALAPWAWRQRCRVLLFSDQEEFVFRPALPWVAVGRISPRAVVRPLSKTKQARIGEVRIRRVTAVDPERQAVMTADGPVAYDLLIVAAGTQPDAAAIPGYQLHAYHIWSLTGAVRLRERLRAGGVRRVVVAAHHYSPCAFGMYELAALLAHAGLDVTLVTTGPAPGFTVGPGYVRVWRRALARRQVPVRSGRSVAEVGRRGVLLDDGTTLDCDVAVVAPPPRGPEFSESLAGAVTRVGLLLTRPSLASILWNTVYGAGGAVALSPPSIGFTAEQMGTVAAHNATIALGLRSGQLREFVPSLAVVHASGGRWGSVVLRRPAPGFGPAGLRFGMAGWPLGYAKSLFRHYYMARRI